MEEGKLPIFEYREELLQAIRDYQVLVIVGDADSGIITQVPQFLYQDGYTQQQHDGKLIGCTQPSSFAAKAVAAHVSKQMQMHIGQEEDHMVNSNSIRFMTDSMLLHQFLAHPNLTQYSVIIVDQANQRTLSTSVLLALLKILARARPDLKLLIISTHSTRDVDAENLSTFFNYAPVFAIPRGKPVFLHYLKEKVAVVDNYLDADADIALQMVVTQPLPGDILLFLPRQEETESAKERILLRHGKTKELIICSASEIEYDSKLFEQPTPQGARKVFLATNNAEASLIRSIYGATWNIKYVIDSGLCERKLFDPVIGTESLVVANISKASAYQRAALCRQTGPGDGTCFRLYTSNHHMQQMEDITLPEIQHRNLTNMVLILKSLGIDDLLSFDIMDRPPTESLNKAVDLLYGLGALDRLGQLTQVGRKMAELFPLDDPMLSKMIVASDHYNCSEEILTIAAMLISTGGDSIFYRPKGKEVQADSARMRFYDGDVGDHIALLMVYNDWKSCDYGTMWCSDNYVKVRSLIRARDTRDQLKGILEKVGLELKSSLNDLEAIKKAIVAGFFPHSAARLHKSGSSYRTIGKHPQTVELDPSSYFAQMQSPPQGWVIYHELVSTTNKYIRLVTELKPEWLLEVAPHYYQ